MSSDEQDVCRGEESSNSVPAADRLETRRGTYVLEAAFAKHLLRQRRRREREIGQEFFAEPAWDMLLDLFASEVDGHPVAKSSLVIAASVPQSTALRWIRDLGAAGLLEPYPDAKDGRRTFIMLSDVTFLAVAHLLTRWVQETRALLSPK